jgi:UDP-2,3-diacylglucosamine hydrolase
MTSMKIAAISDVHVKVPNDDADKLLCNFFNHAEVKSADYVLLLGDIFDLMCGPHDEYLQLYPHLFKKIDELQKNGKKIIFFEGNHDVHLEKLFKKMWRHDEVLITQDPRTEVIDGKSYYFSHGDEHEIDNYSYHRYMRIIRSKPLKFVADFVMPFRVLNFFGHRASKISRKKGAKTFDAEGVRARFRNGVTKTTKGEFDFVLGGHSHVKDYFEIPGSHCLYLNNGYALNSKTFIVIDNHVPKFVPLVEL